MPEIVYTDTDRDYPKGRYEGAVSVTKVRNAMRKAGYELVNAKNSRRNNVLEGSFGFIRDPKSGRLVYFDADASACFNGDKVLYRTAKHEKDYTGGTNNYVEFGRLAEAVGGMFAKPWLWD